MPLGGRKNGRDLLVVRLTAAIDLRPFVPLVAISGRRWSQAPPHRCGGSSVAAVIELPHQTAHHHIEARIRHLSTPCGVKLAP